MADILFKADEYIFDVRTVGVLVRDGKILVQRDKDGDEYALPGGHIKLGETTFFLLLAFVPKWDESHISFQMFRHFLGRNDKNENGFLQKTYPFLLTWKVRNAKMFWKDKNV